MTSARVSGAAILLVTAVVLVARPGVLRSQTAKPDARTPKAGTALAAEDEAGIRKTIRGIEEAWNAHDMEAYGRLLRPDVEWVNVVGMHWRGRDDVMLAHRVYHETIFKTRQIKTDDVQLRPLAPGYAIAVVTTTDDAFTAPDGKVIEKGQNRQTYILAREAEGWKIVHCENVRVDAEAAKFDPTKAPAK